MTSTRRTFTTALVPILLTASLTSAAPPSGTASAPAENERTFLLLVYPIDREKATPAYREKAPETLIAEYRAWAESLKARGLLAGAAKLESDGTLVTAAGVIPGGAPSGQAPISGYFLVRSESSEAASELASTCPHVSYGGTVVVRELAGSRR